MSDLDLNGYTKASADRALMPFYKSEAQRLGCSERTVRGLYAAAATRPARPRARDIEAANVAADFARDFEAFSALPKTVKPAVIRAVKKQAEPQREREPEVLTNARGSWQWVSACYPELGGAVGHVWGMFDQLAGVSREAIAAFKTFMETQGIEFNPPSACSAIALAKSKALPKQEEPRPTIDADERKSEIALIREEIKALLSRRRELKYLQSSGTYFIPPGKRQRAKARADVLDNIDLLAANDGAVTGAYAIDADTGEFVD